MTGIPLFVNVNQEKVLKRISQERLKGDPKRALARALEGLEKFPEDLEITLETIRLCFEARDHVQAVAQMKTAIRKHPRERVAILTMAREALADSFTPLLGSFVIETLLRSRDIEEVRAILRISTPEYMDSLIKRSEIRSKECRDNGNTKNSLYTDNELFLGLLYISSGRAGEAGFPLGRALANSPEDATVIGSLLVELEREVPDSADVKFSLGLASVMLGRAEKSEPRFFQCIQLENAPLGPLLKLLDSIEEPSPNQQLLAGEIMIRMGKVDEGLNTIRVWLETPHATAGQGSGEGRSGEFYTGELDCRTLVFERLAGLPADLHGKAPVAFATAWMAAGLDRIKEAVEELDTLATLDPGRGPEIVEWIMNNESLASTAPGRRLLMKLHISARDFARAAESARVAAEINPAMTVTLIQMAAEALETIPEGDGDLLGLMAELYALNGDSEKAGQIISRLEERDSVDKGELFRLTGKILDKCGLTLDRVISMIDMGLRSGDVSGALPWALEFLRGNPEAQREFASRVEALAGADGTGWKEISALCDSMAKEEQLSRPFKTLQAKAHLNNGEIERSIFEFDQLIIFDESLRIDLIPEYEKAAERNPGNTTLNLALYQINLEEEFFARSAHYLCKALESDPSQIRDILPRFEKLAARDPNNKAIWEEMLRSALALDHLELAREILSRASKALPAGMAASLKIYGARISSADGKSAEGLDCLTQALESSDPDLGGIADELAAIIAREPANPDARYLRGETLLRLGREDEAVDHLEKCLDLSPAYTDRVREKLEELLPMSIKPWLISRVLGGIAWAQQRREDAYRYLNNAQKGPVRSVAGLNETLRKLKESSPPDGRLASIYARGLSLEGRHDESVGELERLHDSDRNASGRIMEVLLELLKAAPEHFDANRLLARIWSDSGDRAGCLEPVLRMISNTGADPSFIDGIVCPYIDILESNPRFLVPYAGLKARAGDFASSLTRYRQALGADPAFSGRILEAMSAIEWPAVFEADAFILSADCLVAESKAGEAFAFLKKIKDPGAATAALVIDRIYALAAAAPAPEFFEHGCDILAGNGDLEGAEKMIRAGCEKLWVAEKIDMLIHLAETMESHGRPGEAARIFTEVLGESGEKEAIWKRIEASRRAWSEKELESGLAEARNGELDPGEAERLAALALEASDHEAALEIIRGSRLAGTRRAVLLAGTYLSMGRPSLALAVTGAASRSGDADPGSLSGLLYVEGRACEMLGDYGRAAAAFSRILAEDGGFGDARARAERNYSKFIASQMEETVEILVKTGEILPD